MNLVHGGSFHVWVHSFYSFPSFGHGVLPCANFVCIDCGVHYNDFTLVRDHAGGRIQERLCQDHRDSQYVYRQQSSSPCRRGADAANRIVVRVVFGDRRHLM